MKAAARLSFKINSLKERTNVQWIEEYPSDILQKLFDYYKRIDGLNEALQVQTVLHERGEEPHHLSVPDDAEEMYRVMGREG
jgi:hypothetical protein